VAMLTRALGLEADAAAAGTFRDAAGFGWASGVIGAAHRAGLISGYPDGTFGAFRQITRAEMAAIISRIIEQELVPVVAVDFAGFADAAAIPTWAREAVATAARSDLVRGFPGNLFRAGNNTTRAEAVAKLYRLVAEW